MVLNKKRYKIAKNPKYDGYQSALANMVYKCFYKKPGSGEKSSVTEEVSQELHKAVIKKLKEINKSLCEIKYKVLTADLAEI